MASQSLAVLLQGLDEVAELQRANPSPTGAAPFMPRLTRVIGRASVVLLSGHFERYIYGVNEEASSFLNASGATGSLIPEFIRLLHTRTTIDDIERMEWS